MDVRDRFDRVDQQDLVTKNTFINFLITTLVIRELEKNIRALKNLDKNKIKEKLT